MLKQLENIDKRLLFVILDSICLFYLCNSKGELITMYSIRLCKDQIRLKRIKIMC
jgi:hypothetical protein